MRDRASFRPRRRDLAALTGFFVLWLAPMAYVGYLGGPPASWPTNLRDLYAVSCLFGPGSTRTSVFYVQVRYAERRGWHDLDESDYFGLEPFGHRTRFDRFMARFGYQEHHEPARRELAQWLAEAHAARNEGARNEGARNTIIAVRYLWADREIHRDAPPTGRWRKPPRAEAGRVRQLGKVIPLALETETNGETR